MNAIEMKGVVKRYIGFTLDGLDLSLPQGAIMGLVGENGAGKTTAIGLMLGHIAADAGEIRVLQQRVPGADFDAARQDIGVVLDEGGLPDKMDAHQVNDIMRRVYRRWSVDEFERNLARLDVPRDKPYIELSHGTKMKMMLAVALSHDAKLLILDEPTGGLDPVMREEILSILFDFTRDEAHSVLISSHIVTDLEKICDYIAYLHQGKLQFSMEKDALLMRYAMLRCTAAQLEDVDPEAVVHRNKTDYGTEALVLRERVGAHLPLDPASLQEIIVNLSKEGMLR